MTRREDSGIDLELWRWRSLGAAKPKKESFAVGVGEVQTGSRYMGSEALTAPRCGGLDAYLKFQANEDASNKRCKRTTKSIC